MSETFGNLAIGSTFKFERLGTPDEDTTFEGPWVKVSARKYRWLDRDPKYRDSKIIYTIGSSRAKVVSVHKNPPTRSISSLEAPKRPKIGDLVEVRGHKCEIFKVRPMGTIDVVTLDGKHAWRVTGLGFR